MPGGLITPGSAWKKWPGISSRTGSRRTRKKHSVDIRLTCTEGRIILRMRDDCAAFDPSQHARILNPDDGVKDYGIRMVYDLAKEVNYQNLLDQNVLTITL